ncbi:hypothetical protein BV25DRAFT_1920088 [Artomyces pyxidatus]|uniref:Uncharacterized protein n=1 Tax=Artomyces pyxidatus TaxID=48021 RepID=A0ACB8SNY6_9AGAM|nr:hypothetical protein BV25DRAFT_1920088 [Artomyces pyxidatus]
MARSDDRTKEKRLPPLPLPPAPRVTGAPQPALKSSTARIDDQHVEDVEHKNQHRQQDRRDGDDEGQGDEEWEDEDEEADAGSVLVAGAPRKRAARKTWAEGHREPKGPRLDGTEGPEAVPSTLINDSGSLLIPNQITQLSTSPGAWLKGSDKAGLSRSDKKLSKSNSGTSFPAHNDQQDRGTENSRVSS